MSKNYDNWYRLVSAVIKKQQLLELFHDQSRSPSVISESSDLSLIIDDTSLDFLIPYDQHQIPNSTNLGLVFVSKSYPIFELEDLIRASFRVLGRGNFGFCYAAELDNGVTVVVKRLKVFDISEFDFKRFMRVVGTVEHQNVAKLVAYYCSREEKLMIYDYYSGGSVSVLLHGKPGEDRANVDWKLRLRIANSASKAINHIHSPYGGNLVHGNIKASNIFLSSQQYGHVSDLGLASMIPTTFPQFSRCYAPEVKSTRNVSQASDVYSFGIFLLELLTRKSPDPSLGHEAVDLVKLVNSVSPKEWTKVFDEDLLVNPTIREQILRMMELGISCVAKSPKKRPKMSAVVKMLEEINMMNMGNKDSIKSESKMNTRSQVSRQTESNKLVFLGDGNPTFDFNGLLRGSAKGLGKGAFGTSYKVTLENGIIVCAKILKDVIVTNEEFQQHMEVTGKVGNNNVAEIKAYCYSRDEMLLVYDYYNQGSLSAILHGKRPLDWHTRLKYAISAAKGIAHIHTKNEQKLVHGNISASNILLNEQQCVVSDVGLGKLASPTIYLVTRNAGYCAPEVTDSRKVSQASDVYSFGVVLLELLSGKPSQITYNGKAVSLVRWTQIIVRKEWEWASKVFNVDF